VAGYIPRESLRSGTASTPERSHILSDSPPRGERAKQYSLLGLFAWRTVSRSQGARRAADTYYRA
jgi:hypothetical protein